MDVREKLVELLEKASYECDEGTRDLWDMRQVADGIADFLIANGVTVQDNTEISEELLKQLRNAPITILQEEPTIEVVQEWISVKDRLPDETKDEYVLAVCDYHGKIKVETRKMWHIDSVVTHWMPLPEPPKEV